MIKISNKDELLKEAKKIINENADSEYQHKVEIVMLLLKGFTPGELEEKKVVSRPTLSAWLRSIEEKGDLTALRGVPSIGRPKKLDEKQFEELTSVLSGDASEYGYSTWDGKAIHDYILKHFNEDICLRHCQRIKHDLIAAEKIKSK